MPLFTLPTVTAAPPPGQAQKPGTQKPAGFPPFEVPTASGIRLDLTRGTPTVAQWSGLLQQHALLGMTAGQVYLSVPPPLRAQVLAYGRPPSPLPGLFGTALLFLAGVVVIVTRAANRYRPRPGVKFARHL